MTDEELQAIREQLQVYDAKPFEKNIFALLTEVDRLRSIIRRAYNGDPDDLYEEGERLASQQERA